MKQSVCCAILFFVLGASSFASQAGARPTEIMGFKTWKSGRVDEAKAAVQRIQLDSSLGAAHADRRLEQARLNVEISQELTVNDYFVLYLKPMKSKDAFVEAARKLSPDEVSELMVAYQKQLSGDDPLAAGNQSSAMKSAKSTF